MLSLTPRELHDRVERGEELLLIDIREDNEVAYCPLAGTTHLPMSQLYDWLEDVALAESSEPAVVVICNDPAVIRASEPAPAPVQSTEVGVSTGYQMPPGFVPLR